MVCEELAPRVGAQDPAELERRLDTLSAIVRGMANGSVRRHVESLVAEIAVSTRCKKCLALDTTSSGLPTLQRELTLGQNKICLCRLCRPS